MKKFLIVSVSFGVSLLLIAQPRPPVIGGGYSSGSSSFDPSVSNSYFGTFTGNGAKVTNVNVASATGRLLGAYSFPVPSGIRAFGDSYVYGTNAITSNSCMVALLSSQLSLPVTNFGAVGYTFQSGLANGTSSYGGGAGQQVYSQIIKTNDITIVHYGFNDSGLVSDLGTMIPPARAMVAWLAIPNNKKVYAATAAKTGAWSTYSIGSFTGQWCIASNAYITATAYGSAVYIGYSANTNLFGGQALIRVEIDGVVMTNFTPVIEIPSGAPVANHNPQVIRFGGLSGSAHTVVVRNICTDSNHEMDIDWFAGNGQLDGWGNPRVLVDDVFHKTTAGNSAYAYGSSANTELASSYIAKLVEELSGDGLSVQLVPVDKTSPPDLTVGSDNIHFTNHVAWASAELKAIFAGFLN